ncbi:MAG: SGNH/GDSL hydrolase family protein [Aquabacterium sp.]|uniref:SGNH/GDSL hydrolase family protein n=1 Tax=Aquabacterium sp. TaxID=1872578 RepID=UPI002A35FE7A|nr:SGNH/GDSL hydrolase family protein [Aquabacterium sp.]MDX9844132.1 SGNH/GDSL hydrolase family protein [Aquabacterium sp.]
MTGWIGRLPDGGRPDEGRWHTLLYMAGRCGGVRRFMLSGCRLECISGDPMFATPSSFLPVSLRRVGLVTLACSALVLSACGGGDRSEDYKPASIVSFGDESSAFASVDLSVRNDDGSVIPGDVGRITGLTYAVNSLINLSVSVCTDPTVGALCASGTTQAGVQNFSVTGTTFGYFKSVNSGDAFNVVTRIEQGAGDFATVKRTTDQFYNCSASSIWTQYVARAFGKGYEAACRLDRAGAVSHAVAGAKVTGLAAQVATAQSAGQLKSGTLVTLWLGQNDLLEVFDNSGLTLAQKEAEAKARAVTLIDGVKQILSTGAKVVLVNAPNLAYSPHALARNAVSCAGVSDRPCNPEMEALVVAFNKQLITSLGTEYALNGRQLGYVDAAQITNSYARNTSYENKRQCDAAKMVRPDGVLDSSSLAYCNVGTLVSSGNVANYLWADDVRVSSTLHSAIASTALTRAAEQF